MANSYWPSSYWPAASYWTNSYWPNTSAVPPYVWVRECLYTQEPYCPNTVFTKEPKPTSTFTQEPEPTSTWNKVVST